MTRGGENALRARFALRAKCRVCLAWLLKRLLCRLAQQWMAWVYIFDGSLNSFDQSFLTQFSHFFFLLYFLTGQTDRIVPSDSCWSFSWCWNSSYLGHASPSILPWCLLLCLLTAWSYSKVQTFLIIIRFWENCPPTPPQSQHFALSEK